MPVFSALSRPRWRGGNGNGEDGTKHGDGNDGRGNPGHPSGERGGRRNCADAVPHVRSTNPALVALIQQASERSATFRGLIETINGSDSFVFVDAGDCGHGVRSCFVSVTASKTSRYFPFAGIH